MKVLLYDEAAFRAGIDPETIEGRGRLKVVAKRISLRGWVRMAYGVKPVPVVGDWKFRKQPGHLFGGVFVNRDGDCLIPEVD